MRTFDFRAVSLFRATGDNFFDAVRQQFVRTFSYSVYLGYPRIQILDS
jgi:hypothetical protein